MAGSPGPSHIQIRGARGHNLRDVDGDIPRARLVVSTGLSGSGESSLALDSDDTGIGTAGDAANTL